MPSASTTRARKDDVLKQRTATAYVFDPHPMAALNDGDLEDGSAIPAMAYRQVTLTDLGDSGYLDGPYCTTSPTRGRYVCATDGSRRGGGKRASRR